MHANETRFCWRWFRLQSLVAGIETKLAGYTVMFVVYSHKIDI